MGELCPDAEYVAVESCAHDTTVMATWPVSWANLNWVMLGHNCDWTCDWISYGLFLVPVMAYSTENLSSRNMSFHLHLRRPGLPLLWQPTWFPLGWVYDGVPSCLNHRLSPDHLGLLLKIGPQHLMISNLLKPASPICFPQLWPLTVINGLELLNS